MSYNPYTHAFELGLTLHWSHDVDEMEGFEWNPETRVLTVLAGMGSIRERCTLAVAIVMLERDVLDSIDGRAALFIECRRVAAGRLIDADRYAHLVDRVDHIPPADRGGWRMHAALLGVTKSILDIYMNHISPTRRITPEAIITAASEAHTQPIQIVR
ncbi:hypothetical protein ACFWGP_05645 [Agromyces sp. NPDC127015]|uniref:hypothetical protein n=1 Tax=Agromyces sp. NPDC127015 TaxID=3347108 RepID=UPI003652813A